MEKRIAVIDLGSNSVRMTINLLHDNGDWSVVMKKRSTVRLSEGMGIDKVLKEEAMLRVIDALKEFCVLAKLDSCQTIVAIATAAVRNAVNRDLFIDRVYQETGIRFDVISGEDEAYYSYLAVTQSLPIKNGLVFDTGGGSTELILIKNGHMVHTASVPLGAVTLTEKFRGRSQAELYRYVVMMLGSVDWIDEAAGLDLYGVGGSAKTLGTLSLKELKSVDEVHGLSVPCNKVSTIYQKVYSTPLSLRQNIPGMEKSRADIILSGLMPMKALMDMLGSKKCTVCSHGVKEGVFFRVRDEILKNEWDKR
ncbi:MAG: exopolyphosphatase [Clostridia bacterium]|nr:exopolyphosphatase [Clostridia bacterium]